MKTKKSRGDIFTILSYIFCGAANIRNGQPIKGLLFLASEIAYVFFMVRSGFANLRNLTTLGDKLQGMVYNEAIGIYEVQQGDNSMLILLYGVVTIVITAAFLALWAFSVASGRAAARTRAEGKHVRTFLEDVRSLSNENVHFSLLSVPVIGLAVFTVMPLIYMILMAFTNYDSEHQPPGHLFDWVGLENFKTLLASSDKLSQTFWPILGWTAVY